MGDGAANGRCDDILANQDRSDVFLTDQLKPELFVEAY